MSASDLIEVAMATDDKYAQHAAAAVHSLLQWNEPSKVRFNFVHGKDSTAGVQKIASMIKQAGGQFRLVPISENWIERLDSNNYYGLYAWLRMLLPELLPDCRRILYLDSDLIVCDRLEEVWNSDLEGKLIGAVLNPFYPHQRPTYLEPLGITNPELYFNSGVLLMDAATIREQGWVERLVRFASDYRDRIQYPDQDTLNAVFAGRWLPLHPRYNAQAVIFDLDTSELPFSPEQSRVAKRKPAIIHYNSMLKPWMDSCPHPHRALYWEHLRKTPWHDAKPINVHWRNHFMRWLPYRAYRIAWKLFVEHNQRRPTSDTRSAK